MPSNNRSLQPTENKDDEISILADQDDTASGLEHKLESNMGAGGTDKLAVDEPGDFVRGEIDVKTQMDRASNAIKKGPR